MVNKRSEPPLGILEWKVAGGQFIESLPLDYIQSPESSIHHVESFNQTWQTRSWWKIYIQSRTKAIMEYIETSYFFFTLGFPRFLFLHFLHSSVSYNEVKFPDSFFFSKKITYIIHFYIKVTYCILCIMLRRRVHRLSLTTWKGRDHSDNKYIWANLPSLLNMKYFSRTDTLIRWYCLLLIDVLVLYIVAPLPILENKPKQNRTLRERPESAHRTLKSLAGAYLHPQDAIFSL